MTDFTKTNGTTYDSATGEYDISVQLGTFNKANNWDGIDTINGDGSSNGATFVDTDGIHGGGTIIVNDATLYLSGALGGGNQIVANNATIILDATNTNSGSSITLQGGGGNTVILGPNSDLNPNASFSINGFTADDSIAVAGQTITAAQYNASSGKWAITTSTGQTYDVAITDPSGSTSNTNLQVGSDGDVTVCFAEGTRIATPAGEVPIETLQPGDSVITIVDGQHLTETVRWIGNRRIDLTTHPRPSTAAPIRIGRDAVAPGVPRRDLLVSPDHAVLLDGVLICARQLVNGMTIRQEVGWTSVRYLHVELDRHAVLLAEGLTAESYLDTGNRGFFANGGMPLVLHPDFTIDAADRHARSCAPLVSDEASVRPIWQRLAERACALGFQPAEIRTETDPALRIAIGNLTLKPVSAARGRHVFVLPAGTDHVHLLSRCGTPGETRPWMEDRRLLGAYVEGVTLRDGADSFNIPLDHAALYAGWWAPEASATRRWTNGNAALRIPPSARPVLLEVRVASSSMRYRIAA